MATKEVLKTRAYQTTMIAYSPLATCAGCNDLIWPSTTKGKTTTQYICANIYKRNKWNRLESYHLECYDKAGRPYGINGTRTAVTMDGWRQKQKKMSQENKHKRKNFANMVPTS